MIWDFDITFYLTVVFKVCWQQNDREGNMAKDKNKNVILICSESWPKMIRQKRGT